LSNHGNKSNIFPEHIFVNCQPVAKQIVGDIKPFLQRLTVENKRQNVQKLVPHQSGQGAEAEVEADRGHQQKVPEGRRTASPRWE
jgi:hypothetical protein